MSEIKTAIEILKILHFCGNCTTGEYKENGCTTCKRKLTKDLAIQALEKQIPESREIIEGKYYCPICECGTKSAGYCTECGQKLY